jgi:catechol 2,3-dioxygenase-like lactoylglutathione lyase family enzyme
MLRNSKAFSGFSVDDLAKAAQFYGQVLGLDVSQDEMGLTLKIQGSNPIFVYQKDDHAPATFTILNFPVDDIDKAVDELVSKRVVFERYDDMPTPQDSRGILRGLAAKMGPDIAWFKDPAGNILSVLQEA